MTIRCYSLRCFIVVSVLVLLVSFTACDNNASDQDEARDGSTDLGADAEQDSETGFVSGDSPYWAPNSDTALETTFSGMGSYLGVDTPSQFEFRESVYRLLSPSTILNLNPYQGLQIIDFGDLSNPKLVGQYQIYGTPVDLHIVDDYAYVLLNDWHGYYGSSNTTTIDTQTGGLLLVVDISDHTHLKYVDKEYIQGNINASQIIQDGEQTFLFIASGHADGFEEDSGDVVWEYRDFVQSFDVSDGTITRQSQIDLGGIVSGIKATREGFVVTRYEMNPPDIDLESIWEILNEVGPEENFFVNEFSTVSIVDISDPSGTLREGNQVALIGRANTYPNNISADLRNGVLRVVSEGLSFAVPRTLHLQTFDASDFSNLEKVDHCTFGEEELRATLFLDDKAFFATSAYSTYSITDPFHAFELSDDGRCEEHLEFIVEGWEASLSPFDIIRPVFNERRLLSVGEDDGELNNIIRIGLYDITDLSNPDSLVDRIEVGFDSNWSNIYVDRRAISILENAIRPETVNDETTLVLLPFSGMNAQQGKYVTALQIFTVSEHKVTHRGTVDVAPRVRQSFLKAPSTVVHLSEEWLSTSDYTSPDSPELVGHMRVAPNYSQILTFGDYVVRLKDNGGFYHFYRQHEDVGLPKASAEIVRKDSDLNRADPIETIEVPALAHLIKAGETLLSVEVEMPKASSEPFAPPTVQTTIDIYDLTDPTSPRFVDTLGTDQIKPLDYDRCFTEYNRTGELSFDCYRNFGLRHKVHIINNNVVFVEREQNNEGIGTERICTKRYDASLSRCRVSEQDKSCSEDYSGQITCRTLDDSEEICTGEIVRCVRGTENVRECASVDPDSISVVSSCEFIDSHRYWDVYSFHVLDLSESKPRLITPIEMPSEEEGVSVISDAASIYYSYKVPVERSNNPHSLARYYFKEIDLTTPANPQIGEPINIPGELLFVDGSTIYTREFVWDSSTTESVVNKLEREQKHANLRASFPFPGRTIERVEVDYDANRLFVSHQPSWNVNRNADQYRKSKLTTLSANDLVELGTIEIDHWATLLGARSGRTIFEVPQGLLVFNFIDPKTPFPQVYFPALARSQDILFEDDYILLAAGPYGIHQIKDDIFNLIDRSELVDP